MRRLERLGLSRSAASVLMVAITFVSIVGGTAAAATRLVNEASSFYEDVVGEPATAVRAEDGSDVSQGEARRFFAQELRGDEDEPAFELGRTEWEGRELWYVDEDRNEQFRPGLAREGIAKVRRDLAESGMGQQIAEQLEVAEDLGPIIARSAGNWLTRAADFGKSAAGTLLGILTLVVLFPIYLYYSLANLAHVYDVGIRHLPAAHRDRVVDILQKIHLTLSAFFRGRLILLLVKFVALFLMFLLFGVPFAGLCAGFAAIASLVPVLGSVAGGIVPLLLLLSTGAGSGRLLGLLAGLIAIEIVEQYVLTPAIIGKRVGLHPLTILVCTFVAGELLGLFGMLVAIPLTAVVKILAIEFVLPEIRRRAAAPPLPPDAPQ